MASVVGIVPPHAGTAVEEVHARRGHDALVEVRAAAIMAKIVEAHVERGDPENLGPVRSASATQTLDCAMATINGRASESLKAAAKLIGKRMSAVSNGAGFSFMPVASSVAPAVGP